MSRKECRKMRLELLWRPKIKVKIIDTPEIENTTNEW
jgi:hypothetical protein